MRKSRLLTLIAVVIALFAAACNEEASEAPSAEFAGEPPEWVEKVYPPPGADASVPDAVEIRYIPQGPNQIVRLVIDGIDVSTYSHYDAGLVRYESGRGPVVFEGEPHEVEVLLTERPTNDSISYTVVDRWSYTFRGA